MLPKHVTEGEIYLQDQMAFNTRTVSPKDESEQI